MMAQRLLEEDGCAVDTAGTLESARVLAMVNEYDGIILDLHLPDGNGIALIQELRKAGRKTALLVLTGTKASETAVRALDAGADDYVNKPIVFDQFKARMRALVRRGGAQRLEQLAAGNVVVNRLSRDVLVGGQPVSVTPRELALLEHLLLHTGQVVKRTDLLESVMDMSFDPGTNVIDVNVSRLRRKLKGAGATVKIIARRGLGFVLTPDA